MPVDSSGVSQILFHLQQQQQQDLREVKQDLKELATKQDFNEVKQDLREVKQDLKDLRVAVQQDLKEQQQQQRQDVKELRLAVQQGFKDQQQGFASKQELRWYAITLLLIAAAAGAKELLSFVKVL